MQLTQVEGAGRAHVPVALQYNLGSRVVSIVCFGSELELRRDSVMISEAIQRSRFVPNCCSWAQLPGESCARS